MYSLRTTTSLFAGVVTLLLLQPAFADTPRTLDDPEAYRKAHPQLASDHLWTEYATPDQVKLFDGPETTWPQVPDSEYNLSGFDSARLYSKVPAPGVHPRILFSPEDVPTIKKQLENTKEGQRVLIETDYFLGHTIYDPQADEGKIFQKLSTGDLTGLAWPDDETTNITCYFKGYKSLGTFSVHSGYFPRLLEAAAFRALLNDDKDQGTKVATAMANYWKLRESIIDQVNNSPDHASDYWRPMHQIVAATHLGFGYDFAAKWMTPDQLTLMRRVISKATSGKLSYGENGPGRWRETNWTGWDLTHFLVSISIEGEPGYDATILPVAKETTRDYFTWAIDDHGLIYETNGKNGEGLLCALTAAQVLARRGDNFLGNPHLRKLTTAQVQDVVPQGGLNVNNGTWGCGTFSGEDSSMLKAFFPTDKAADWLLRQAKPDLATFDPQAYGQELGSKGPAHDHPASKFDLLDGSTTFTALDWQGFHKPDGTLKEAWERDDLNLPLTFNDPVHGLLATRTSNDKDALFMMFEARPDMRTVGHQHHDAGSFYLAALGEMWAVEAGRKSSFSADHNTVQIDGRGYSDVSAAPKVEYLDPVMKGPLTIAVANLKNAYDFAWTSPMHFSWHDPNFAKWKLSPETDPDVVAYYKGTQHYKMRIWGPDYENANWGPTMRIEGNPVLYAYRSAGIVAGTHPYALVTDDRNKDGNTHRYDWLMQLPEGTHMIPANVGKGAPPAIILTRQPAPPNSTVSETPAQTLPKDEPGLLVCMLDQVDTNSLTAEANMVTSDNYPIRVEELAAPAVPGSAPIKTRLVITKNAIDPNFRILLIPVKGGAPLPTITYDGAGGKATLGWSEGKDTLQFTTTPEHLTRVELAR